MPPKAGPCRAPEHGAGITRNGSPACREREGRHGGGGRRAQLHPQVSMNSRYSFLCSSCCASPPHCPALLYPPPCMMIGVGSGGGCWQLRGGALPIFTRCFGGEDLNTCTIFGWWNRAGKAFPCIIYFPLLLPFGSSDWQTSEWGFGSLCPALRQAHIHGRLAD